MRKLKLYHYELEDGFLSGQFWTWNKRRVRRHIRQLLGWGLYLKVRKILTITEVEE